MQGVRVPPLVGELRYPMPYGLAKKEGGGENKTQQAKQSVVFEVITGTPYDPWVRKIPWRRG